MTGAWLSGGAASVVTRRVPVAVGGAVGDGVGDGVGSGPALGRGVGDLAVLDDGVPWVPSGDLGEGELVAVGVGVVDEHVDGDGWPAPVIGVVVLGDRRAVERRGVRGGDGERAGDRVAAVGDEVVDRLGAGPSSLRGERGDGSVTRGEESRESGGIGDLAVLRLVPGDEGERVLLGVAVVGQEID